MTEAPFDTRSAFHINEARKNYLKRFLLDLREQREITTALDAGCGFGFFSRCLLDSGLQVQAIDVRPENVAEAERRNPGVEFKVYDVENPSIAVSFSTLFWAFISTLRIHFVRHGIWRQ